jgi:hypothetical protein
MAAENHAVELACRVLAVSESGFYAQRGRAPSARAIRHAALTDLIRRVHADSRGIYGARRVYAELTLGHGIAVGRCAVEMLMQCLVDQATPDFFAGVHTGPWTYASGCWLDSTLPAGQTLLGVHGALDATDARVRNSITILCPTVADVTGAGTTFPTGAYGQFNSPTGVTWLFVVPRLSLFSGVYFMSFDSGDNINLGAVAYTP